MRGARRAMWKQVFGLKSSADEETFKMALDLAEPTPGEDKSLPLHVEICSRRFKAVVDLMKAQYDQSRSNKFLLLVTIGILVLTKVLTVDGIVAAIKESL
jgi:hypothetical protein